MREELKTKYITNKRFEIYSDLNTYNNNLKKSKSLSSYDDKMRFTNLKQIFPNLPSKDELLVNRQILSTKLNHIRKFRNRVFHHENIIKDEFDNIENDIYEILGCFDSEVVEYARNLNNE